MEKTLKAEVLKNTRAVVEFINNVHLSKDDVLNIIDKGDIMILLYYA